MYQDSTTLEDRIRDIRETKEKVYADTKDGLKQLETKLTQFKAVTVDQIS